MMMRFSALMTEPEETGKLGFETADGENQKILPTLLHTAANGGNHNQAA